MGIEYDAEGVVKKVEKNGQANALGVAALSLLGALRIVVYDVRVAQVRNQECPSGSDPLLKVEGEEGRVVLLVRLEVVDVDLLRSGLRDTFFTELLLPARPAERALDGCS